MLQNSLEDGVAAQKVDALQKIVEPESEQLETAVYLCKFDECEPVADAAKAAFTRMYASLTQEQRHAKIVENVYPNVVKFAQEMFEKHRYHSRKDYIYGLLLKSMLPFSSLRCSQNAVILSLYENVLRKEEYNKYVELASKGVQLFQQ